MALVRSSLSYPEFIAGRDVSDALHREDDVAGDVIGNVPRARSADEAITQEQFDAEKQIIEEYNRDYFANLPPEPPPPPHRDATLEAALGGSSMTVAKMQTALLDWLQNR